MDSEEKITYACPAYVTCLIIEGNQCVKCSCLLQGPYLVMGNMCLYMAWNSSNGFDAINPRL